MKKLVETHTLLTVFVAINTTIFVVLSALHFYWGFGGRVWYEDVLPTNSKGFNRFRPGAIATFIVAFGLLLFAFITSGNAAICDRLLTRMVFKYGAFIIAILFFLRAVGDFKFIGFFKTVNYTRFAENDTLFFSPMCLCIAILSLLIAVFNKSQP